MRHRLLLLLSIVLAPLLLLTWLHSTIPIARAASTWTVGVDPGCATIQDCINNASVLDGDTIHIPTGIYTEQVMLSKNLILRGDNPLSTTVTAAALGRVFRVTAARATFEDMTIADGQRFSMFDQGAGIYASGSLTLVNVILLDNVLTADSGQGAGVYVVGDVFIQDSLFQGNQCNNIWCSGGGLQAGGTGEVTIVNTDFISNFSGWRGGGVINPPGLVTMIGGRFQGNQAISSNAAEPLGGGVYASILVMSGTVLANNEAVQSVGSFGKGGGVYASSMTLTNTTFTDNYALHMGGAIFGDGRITGGLLEGNNALLAGAIGSLNSTDPWLISDTTFLANSTSAIYASADTTIVNSHFDNNEDRVFYGANGSAWLTMTGTIVENTSGVGVQAIGPVHLESSHFISNVGGIFAQQSLDIASSSFVSNSGGFGAGVRASSVQVRDSLFAYNHCPSPCLGGAGIYATTAAVTNTRFLSNTVDGVGAGLYATGMTTIRDSLFQGNSATSQGAGIYISGGNLRVDRTDFISNTASATAASYAGDAVTVTNSLFQGNQGGGLGGGLSVVVSSSRFLDNTSLGGKAGIGGGVVRVSNSLLQNNICTDSGCLGAGIGGSDVTIISTTIRGSRSGNGGAAIAVSINSITVTDSLIEDNRCTSSNCIGGALRSLGRVTVANSVVISNASDGNGGGIYASDAIRISHSRLENNRCTGITCFGGGAYSNSNLSGISVINSQILSSSAHVGGGGLYTNGPVTITGTLFENNICTSQSCLGGGLQGFNLTIDNGTFHDNESQSGGGAAYGNAITVTQSSFTGNRCLGPSCRGGALHSSGIMLVEQSIFENNFAQDRGGAIGATAFGAPVTPVSLTNLLLADNRAGDQGAAIFLWSGSSATILHSTIAASTSVTGTAVYALGSNLAITNTLITGHQAGIANGSFGGLVSEDYNLFFDNTINLTGTVASGGNSLTADPDFRDPASGNYRLGANSSAIDNALSLGLLVDLDGNTRPVGPGSDRGAYEAIYADVAVHTTITPAGPLLPGQPVTVTFDYSNSGPFPALSSTVSANLSPPLAGLNVSSTHPVTPTGALSWDVGTLPVGSGRIITLSAQVPVSLTSATLLSATASISSASLDIMGANDQHADMTTVSVPTIQLISNVISATEDAATALLTVTLDLINPYGDTTIDFATVDGTAAAGVDYVAANGTLTIAAGQATAAIPITLLDNLLDQPDRSFTLQLSNPSGGALGVLDATLITIIDDEYGIFLPLVLKG